MIFGGRVEIKDKQKHVYATIDFAQENKQTPTTAALLGRITRYRAWVKKGRALQTLFWAAIKPEGWGAKTRYFLCMAYLIAFRLPWQVNMDSYLRALFYHCPVSQRRKQTKHHCYCLLGSCTLETVSPHNKTSYKEILTIQTGRLNYLSLTHINIVMHHHNTF